MKKVPAFALLVVLIPAITSISCTKTSYSSKKIGAVSLGGQKSTSAGEKTEEKGMGHHQSLVPVSSINLYEKNHKRFDGEYAEFTKLNDLLIYNYGLALSEIFLSRSQHGFNKNRENDLINESIKLVTSASTLLNLSPSAISYISLGSQGFGLFQNKIHPRNSELIYYQASKRIRKALDKFDREEGDPLGGSLTKNGIALRDEIRAQFEAAYEATNLHMLPDEPTEKDAKNREISKDLRGLSLTDADPRDTPGIDLTETNDQIRSMKEQINNLNNQVFDLKNEIEAQESAPTGGDAAAR